MSSRRIHHVSEAYGKDVYTSAFAADTTLRNYGQYANFARVTAVSQVLVFHFTTPFSGCLQRRI